MYIWVLSHGWGGGGHRIVWEGLGRCTLVGGSMPLEWAWSLPKSQFLSLFPHLRTWRSRCKHSAPCLAVCCHVSYHDDNGLIFWNCKPAPINFFFFVRVVWPGCHLTVIEQWFRQLACTRSWALFLAIQTYTVTGDFVCPLGFWSWMPWLEFKSKGV